MELLHGTDEWYCSTDYIHGNLYEAEELFRQGHEVQSNTLYLIHYPDGIVYEPIPKDPNQYIGCYEIVGDKIMKKNWKIIFWPGLILPVISFVVALLFPLNMVMPPEGVTSSFVLEMIVSFLLANIPTVILLGIYFGCREKIRRKKQLEKMNIQDLQ